jgi:hypothetical protein
LLGQRIAATFFKDPEDITLGAAAHWIGLEKTAFPNMAFGPMERISTLG